MQEREIFFLHRFFGTETCRTIRRSEKKSAKKLADFNYWIRDEELLTFATFTTFTTITAAASATLAATA